MRKIIWTCWFQGLRQAPELVRKCLASWHERNPEWDFRVLDASTISRYVDLGAHIDLTRQSITAASLSDILRVLLLHEYGGVWVDATVRALWRSEPAPEHFARWSHNSAGTPEPTWSRWMRRPWRWTSTAIRCLVARGIP